MKKLVVTVLFVVTALTAYSQSNFGIRVGANISDITQLSGSFKTNFYAGLLLSSKLSDKYTLQPEISYSKQGTQLDTPSLRLQGTDNKTVMIDYLTLSLANKLYVAKNLHLLIGPSIDIKVWDNIREYNPSWSLDFFPKLDVAFIGGLVYDVNNNLSIDARLKHGIVQPLDFLDIYGPENNNGNVVVEGEDNANRYLNRVIQVGITYRFDFK